MTQEQKAKAYDKAIEKLRDFYRDYDTVSNLIDVKEELAKIFPELKESKDNRIMRVIRGWIYTRPASFFDNGISKEEILAWLEKQNPNANKEYWRGYREGKQEILDKYAELEKQGKQESIDPDTLIQQRVGAPADIVAEQNSTDKELKKIKNDIEIPFGAKDSELQEATYFIPKGFHAEIDDDKVVIKKGEKPTAWSEDDENILKDIKKAVIHYYGLTTQYILLDWLKSLKERIRG